MTTAAEDRAYARAAEVGMRAVRRRYELHMRPCHVPPDLAGTVFREVAVGVAGAQCLPERTRVVDLNRDWLWRHHGLVVTVTGSLVTSDGVVLVLHAPEGDVVYDEDPLGYDWATMGHRFVRRPAPVPRRRPRWWRAR